MGCDICYTNHAEADQDDMDTLLTLLGVAGINFIMGIPGSDDIMLNYQTTSFHDALYARQTLGLKPGPEFEQWLERTGIFTQADGRCASATTCRRPSARPWRSWDRSRPCNPYPTTPGWPCAA
jgi:ethanolamine ammonia-lyase large subunit